MTKDRGILVQNDDFVAIKGRAKTQSSEILDDRGHQRVPYKWGRTGTEWHSSVAEVETECRELKGVPRRWLKQNMVKGRLDVEGDSEVPWKNQPSDCFHRFHSKTRRGNQLIESFAIDHPSERSSGFHYRENRIANPS